jgi:hypothetical protein
VNKNFRHIGWVLIPLALAGCHKGQTIDSMLPMEPAIVSGFPGAVPSKVRSAAIWGNDERTVNSAITWLGQHGMAVYGPGKVEGAIAKGAGKDDLSLINEGVVLGAARKAGVDYVVFADRLGDSRPPAVSIRAVDAQDGRILWAGQARFGTAGQLPSNASLSYLTDQALGAAWGVKPVEE